MTSFAAYLYLLRVPLLSWLFILLFGPLAMNVGILRNLLLSGVAGETWTLIMAMLVCRAAQASSANILTYGPRRFGVRFQPPGWLFTGAVGALCGWFGSGGGFLAAGFAVIAYTLSVGSWARALSFGFIALFSFLFLHFTAGAIVGAVLFLCFVWLINRFGKAFAEADKKIIDPDSKTMAAVAEFLLFGVPAIVLGLYMAVYSKLGLGTEIYPLTIALPISFLAFWFTPKFVTEWQVSRKIERGLRPLLCKLPPIGRWSLFKRATVTLFDFNHDGRITGIPAGHWPLVVLDVLAVISFFWLSSAKSANLASGQLAAVPGWSPANAPALAFLFLGLAILCLAGSFLTFWFDRFRVPLILPLVLITWLGSTSSTDHIFPVRPHSVSGRPSAQSLIENHPKLILVAAAGGGVQAAGWTARVLEGLKAENPDFKTAVRAISSVSGGAVGTMYYMESLLDPNSKPDDAFKSAVSPSLDVFSWALISRDLPTALFGPLIHRGSSDRAEAFEQVLARRSHLQNVWISDWALKTGATLPAVLFNAFEVDTGRPVVISTSQFPKKENFVDLTENYNLQVVTAVRLSSSFSFVSPVARPDISTIRSHIGDGGYFDNFGLVSLIEWLRAALADGAKPDIMIIKIISFPAELDKPLKPEGWGYQLYAPATGILNMRSMAQLVRGDSELDLLAKKVSLQTLEFRFDGKDGCATPPLSWDLSAAEVNCFANSWDSQSSQRARVTAFLTDPSLIDRGAATDSGSALTATSRLTASGN